MITLMRLNEFEFVNTWTHKRMHLADVIMIMDIGFEVQIMEA